jgi:hypothetical protein
MLGIYPTFAAVAARQEGILNYIKISLYVKSGDFKGSEESLWCNSGADFQRVIPAKAGTPWTVN